MDEDSIAILTLPYSNDLSTIYSSTNNIFTLFLILFQIILLISFIVFSYCIPTFFVETNRTSTVYSPQSLDDLNISEAYSVLIYAHIGTWILIWLLNLYLTRWYYKKMDIIGYHNHHSKVMWMAKVPGQILNKSNALLLVVTTLVYQHKELKMVGFHLNFTPINLIQTVVTLSVAVILPFLMKQLYHEVVFRRDRKPPDVFCIDDPQHLQSAGLSEATLRSSTYLEDLLERQAVLINNLKLQNTHLRLVLFKVSQSRFNSTVNTSTES